MHWNHNCTLLALQGLNIDIYFRDGFSEMIDYGL